MTDVHLPELGESVTEGTIIQWLKAPGDEVALDEALVEISTDKVDTEIPSPVAGTLIEIVAPEGETVDVGARLAVIGSEADAVVEPPSPGETEPRPEPESPPEPAAAAAPEPLAPPPAEPPPPTPPPAEPATPSPTDAPLPAAPMPAPPAPAPARRQGDEIVALSPMRRATGQHLVQSLATSAHMLVAREADYGGVDKVRDHLDGDLGYLPFVARAVVDALGEFGHLNATVGAESLIVHRSINLGITVHLDPEGLVVPVMHDATDKRLAALAREAADLAYRAAEGALEPQEVSGATFTVSNAADDGTLLTGPIISQSQVAILAIDGIKVRPVAVPMDEGGHSLAFHPVGNLALSFDHRAVDGAYASNFLARVVNVIETRDWAAEI